VAADKPFKVPRPTFLIFCVSSPYKKIRKFKHILENVVSICNSSACMQHDIPFPCSLGRRAWDGHFGGGMEPVSLGPSSSSGRATVCCSGAKKDTAKNVESKM
jgi:hypothetical protein